MARLIGYARVSTKGQKLNLQIKALIKAGCKRENIFTDKVSGVKSYRPGLDDCFYQLRKGDILVVWRLDRLGRSMEHLISLITKLKNKKVGFKSISDGGIIDTSSASGELIFNIISAVAQFERTLNVERTLEGLETARDEGRIGGRRPVKSNDPQVKKARKLHRNQKIKVSAICRILKISRGTFYRWLKLS